jgi:hypothetical protein
MRSPMVPHPLESGNVCSAKDIGDQFLLKINLIHNVLNNKNDDFEKIEQSPLYFR